MNHPAQNNPALYPVTDNEQLILAHYQAHLCETDPTACITYHPSSGLLLTSARSSRVLTSGCWQDAITFMRRALAQTPPESPQA